MNRRKTHGEGGTQNRTPEYTAWAAMIQRCCNPNRFNYERYGGRGITVCQRWRDSFPAFLADVGRKPGPKYTLDRYPNQKGNYEPGNVRWATPKEQARNTRRNVLLTIKSVTKSLSEWAEQYRIRQGLVSYRINILGWDVLKALTAPVVAGQKTKPRTHCKRGHELIESNVYRSKDGRRECRACKLARMRLAGSQSTLKGD